MALGTCTTQSLAILLDVFVHEAEERARRFFVHRIDAFLAVGFSVDETANLEAPEVMGDGRLLLPAPPDEFRDIHRLFKEEEHELDSLGIADRLEECAVCL